MWTVQRAAVHRLISPVGINRAASCRQPGLRWRRPPTRRSCVTAASTGGKVMGYKDMFTVLVIDSRIKQSRSLSDTFERILGCLRDVHHLRTDLLDTTADAVVRLRNDASVACVLLEWG